MNILQLVSCAMGRHRRDRHSVWHDGDSFRSTCIGCGVPMVRDFHGWHVLSDAAAETAKSQTIK